MNAAAPSCAAAQCVVAASQVSAWRYFFTV